MELAVANLLEIVHECMKELAIRIFNLGSEHRENDRLSAAFAE